MLGVLDTAGELLAFDSQLHWVADLIAEGAGGELLRPDMFREPSVHVVVEASREAFDTRHSTLLARGAFKHEGAVVIENACSAGFDLHVQCTPTRAEFTFRWRPPSRDRVAARMLRSRFHLLARAVLMQYPALWWSGTNGRVPLHACACLDQGARPLIVSASGVGRSTLVLRELEAGGAATGDNLAAGDGTTVWGLAEPVRVEGAAGRRMPHSRGEMPLPQRVSSLTPDCIVVLERGAEREFELNPCDPVRAARSIVTTTYMAGELRRYWGLAATLAAGAEIGPAHPPVADIAAAFAARLPCRLLRLGTSRSPRLSELFEAEVEAWAS
jgi:hypothetical protein